MAFENDGDKQDSIQKFLDYFYSTDVYTNFVAAEDFLPITKSGAEQFDDPDMQVFLDAAARTPSSTRAPTPAGRPRRARCRA